MKKKNLNEFKELIDRYESITIDDIEEVEKGLNVIICEYGWAVANKITGFGGGETCSLCKATDQDCDNCVWSHGVGSDDCTESYTIPDVGISYDNISKATGAKKLLKAFKFRARVMRNFLKINHK